MRIKAKYPRGQVYLAAFIIFLTVSCGGKKEEIPVIPPPTSPLSQPFIGFGVVNVSYTRVTADPEEGNHENNASPGYLRRGAMVRIHERRLTRNDGNPESWVLVEGACKGWIRESLIDVYDNELQAQTASQSMGR